jgi:putative hydrolase of the HAD superfamily
MIKVIIFDLGGVVLTNDWHMGRKDFVDDFTNKFNMSPEDMERGWRAVHCPFFEGKISENEFWIGFLRAAGAGNGNVEEAKKIWRNLQRPLEGMSELLKKLKVSYRLAALSNISNEWLDFKRERFGLDRFFDVIVNSGAVGVRKPDPLMYKTVLEELGEDPHKFVFIDDKERNLKPAQELGMRTILFIGQKDLEEKLNEMGVRF